MSRPAIDHEARAEDLAWMAATGEVVAGAAFRLGITVRALERWCERMRRLDLLHALRANEEPTIGAPCSRQAMQRQRMERGAS